MSIMVHLKWCWMMYGEHLDRTDSTLLEVLWQQRNVDIECMQGVSERL